MDSEIEKTKLRLKSFLDQLQVERGILDRMVYKNKNQHRRCSYFQYLLKGWRSIIQCMIGSDIVYDTNLKRRKCDGKHNFLERLLGAARLLSQIVELMLKAAMEISKVLARSFFMGFSLTVMAMLCTPSCFGSTKILLDVVTVFNVASSLSRKEQSVKLIQDGLEVFRDLYPTTEQQAVYLECVWEADKFVLIEWINLVMDLGEDLSLGASAIQYHSIETLLGEDEPVKLDPNFSCEQDPSNIKEDYPSLPEGVANKTDDSKPVEDGIKVEDFSSVVGTFSKNGLLTHSCPRSNSLKVESGLRNKVAFVSVKRPTLSPAGRMKWSFLSRTLKVAMPTTKIHFQFTCWWKPEGKSLIRSINE